MSNSNEIGLSGVSHGPESSLHGKIRHRVVLLGILKSEARCFGPKALKVSFFTESPGAFKKDVKCGVQRRVFEDNLLSVELGLSLEMVLASDREFQEYFEELIRRGANTLLEFAESKGVQISKEEFWTVIAESLLLVDFALGQREAAGVLWVRVPEVFTFRDLVRFHASSPDQVLVHLARGDARLERVLLLREGRGPIKEPFEGTILANRLRREGRKLEALDCLRDCLAADGTLWELAVKMAHGIQELSPAESRLMNLFLKAGWPRGRSAAFPSGMKLC